MLDLDRREDKASLMPKLKELAETVQGNAKLGENSRKAATDALDYWKSGT